MTLTLHVGYGTFKPVRADNIEEHVVDPEAYAIPAETADAIDQTRAAGGRVIAVGTTTTRALEDAARHADGRVTARQAEATVFIHPGFTFNVIDGLVTQLSPAEIVAADARGSVRRARAGARRISTRRSSERYRFYSYGDAMLIM